MSISAAIGNNRTSTHKERAPTRSFLFAVAPLVMSNAAEGVPYLVKILSRSGARNGSRCTRLWVRTPPFANSFGISLADWNKSNPRVLSNVDEKSRLDEIKDPNKSHLRKYLFTPTEALHHSHIVTDTRVRRIHLVRLATPA